VSRSGPVRRAGSARRPTPAPGASTGAHAASPEPRSARRGPRDCWPASVARWTPTPPTCRFTAAAWGSNTIRAHRGPQLADPDHRAGPAAVRRQRFEGRRGVPTGARPSHPLLALTANDGLRHGATVAGQLPLAVGRRAERCDARLDSARSTSIPRRLSAYHAEQCSAAGPAASAVARDNVVCTSRMIARPGDGAGAATRGAREAAAGTPTDEAVVLHAMQGRIDESRMLHAEADCIVDDLGSRWLSAIRVFGQWQIALLAGAPERAEADARASLELFQQTSATNGARPLPRSLPSRSSSRTATRRHCTTPTSPPTGRRRTTWPPRWDSSVLARASSRRVASSSLRRVGSRSSPTRPALRRHFAARRRPRRFRRRARSRRTPRRGHGRDPDAIVLYERKGNVVSTARARATLECLVQGAGAVDA
jgi:hypothetical protein